MIKAAMTNRDTGEISLLLGLTDFNLERLQAGEPIVINLSELGLGLVRTADDDSGCIMITHGKDQRALGLALGIDIQNPAPGDQTRIRIDRKDVEGHGHGTPSTIPTTP